MIELTLNDWLKVISHWDKIVLATKKENFLIKAFLNSRIMYTIKYNSNISSVDYGQLGCHFCYLFHANNCIDCPVKLKTGEEYCRKTPYIDFYHSKTQKNIHKHAVRERDFLLSIAPMKRIKNLNYCMIVYGFNYHKTKTKEGGND